MEKVIEWRLRKEKKVTKNQFCFMFGRSTMEAIYLLRRVIECLEKFYKKSQRIAYIWDIQDMYEGVSTSMGTHDGETKGFPITIGLSQCSTFTSYLFTLILILCTHEKYPRASSEMHAFWIWYSPTYIFEWRFKWDVRDLKLSLRNVTFA